VAPGQPTD